MKRFSFLLAMLALALALGLAFAGCASISATRVDGSSVPGFGLEKKLTWITGNAENGDTYVIEMGSNTKIDGQKLQYLGGDITIILRGKDKDRIISPKKTTVGTMFEVYSGITFVLDGNITIQGGGAHDVYSLVHVGREGTLIMNSGTSLTGNYANGFAGGVHVMYGTFIMNGGTISGNYATNRNGGGVHVEQRGTFVMNGGAITGNTTTSLGGGVLIVNGTFTKTGGVITGSDAEDGNRAGQSGGADAVYAVISTNNGRVIVAEKRRNTTSGPEDTLYFDFITGESTGAWDE